MAEHPVTNYIHEGRKRGMSIEQIEQALTAAGWQTHEILEIVLEHGAPAGLAAPVSGVSGDNIIYVAGVSKHYGQVKALDNISLNVKRGGVTALLGPNG